MILLVAVVVVPARYWPDVARFLARTIKMLRQLIWRITDASENLKQQIELEQPIDEIIRTTTDEVLDSFSDVIPKNKSATNTKKKKVVGK